MLEKLKEFSVQYSTHSPRLIGDLELLARLLVYVHEHIQRYANTSDTHSTRLKVRGPPLKIYDFKFTCTFYSCVKVVIMYPQTRPKDQQNKILNISMLQKSFSSLV